MGMYLWFDQAVMFSFTALVLCCFIHSRYAFKTTMAISLVTNAAVFAISYTLTAFTSYALMRPYIMILLLCINMLMSMCLSIERDYRAFFSVTLVISFSMAIQSMSEIIYDTGGSKMLSTIVSIIVCGIVAYFSIKWLSPIVTVLMEEMPEIWNRLWLIPSAFIVLHFLLAITPCNVHEYPHVIPALIALILIQIFIYYFIFSFYNRFISVLEEKQNIQAMNVQTALMMNQRDSVLEIENRIRIFRHDTRHYVQLLSSCLTSGRTEEAASLLQEMDRQVTSQTSLETYCSNFALNAVISNYKSRSDNNGVRFLTSIHLPAELPVDDLEFAVVLSNSLENAFHACLDVEDERYPYISLSCSLKDDKLFLEVKNTYSGRIYFEKNGRLPAAVDENHGIGTRSISAFAEKHNAILDYNAQDGIFTMHMLLYIDRRTKQ